MEALRLRYVYDEACAIAKAIGDMRFAQAFSDHLFNSLPIAIEIGIFNFCFGS